MQLCVRLGPGQPRLLELCQAGALQCMGRAFTLASHQDCTWPAQTSESCEDCRPGTVCQGQASEGGGHCICWQFGATCFDPFFM